MRECGNVGMWEYQYSNLRSPGARNQVATTTTMVIPPPKTTAGITPMIREVRPLSKAPNSLDDMMKIEFNAATRPRISSGVCNCRMVERTITLIPSSTPLMNKANMDSQNI